MAFWKKSEKKAPAREISSAGNGVQNSKAQAQAAGAVSSGAANANEQTTALSGEKLRQMQSEGR